MYRFLFSVTYLFCFFLSIVYFIPPLISIINALGVRPPPPTTGIQKYLIYLYAVLFPVSLKGRTKNFFFLKMCHIYLSGESALCEMYMISCRLFLKYGCRGAADNILEPVMTWNKKQRRQLPYEHSFIHGHSFKDRSSG